MHTPRRRGVSFPMWHSRRHGHGYSNGPGMNPTTERTSPGADGRPTTARLRAALRDTRPLVMGILNVTPDSFSDGGRFTSLDSALRHAERMAAEGADIIDVGGESTRPGAQAVSETEELERVIPVIEAIRRELAVPVSIDTSKAGVMREAVAAGADMINDVRALREAGALAAAREAGVPVCLMHMRGEPRTMQQAPDYTDVCGEVMSFLRERVDACLAAGMAREDLVIDPGFGFGKTLVHNLALFQALPAFSRMGLAVLVGVSRKSMLGTILDRPADERLHGSLALAALAVRAGVRILRVHDVAATVDVVRVCMALQAAEASATPEE